jgi:hypothetical protein
MPEKVAVSFLDAINSHDVDRLCELMAEDHIFIDADGTRLCGRQKMKQAWVRYYTMVPDYRIRVDETYLAENRVVFLGTAEGTFSQGGILLPENHWSVPAAWKAVIDGSRVAVWQLYVNQEPMRKILDRMRDA